MTQKAPSHKPQPPSKPASKTGAAPGQRAKPVPPSLPSPTLLDRATRLFVHFERFLWDIAGVILLALTLMTLLALLLPQFSGGLLAWWARMLMIWFGWGSGWLVSAFGIFSVWILRRKRLSEGQRVPWGRVLALEVAALTSLALLAVSGGFSVDRAETGQDGGRIGWGLAELLRLLLGMAGLTNPLWLILLLSGLLLMSLVGGLGLLEALVAWARRAPRQVGLAETGDLGNGAVISEAPIHSQPVSLSGSIDPKKRRPALPPEFRQKLTPQPGAAASLTPPPPRDERLPGLELLINEHSSRPDERNINLTAGLIVKTLAEFGIPAKVVGYRVGPTVTQFAIEPGFVEKEKPGAEGDLNRQKVRVAQISALGRDLALALSAERLRIEAPVPGRPYVGIEVPNTRSSMVRLRPILEADAFYKVGSPLTIALGRDVSGQPVVADLGRMPHLLVAGTTGSGKSVCIAALTTCLVMNNTPEDLRLVLVDPKMVELVPFNGLPHLLGKVETELERILAVLRWIVAEMDRRYKLLEASHARNIETYNRKARRRKGEEPLPRIVLMIDELADLMMSAPEQTEHSLVRLAQMARATGIHLVVATQRPSTDVVTGLIKANFPARISFAVASSIDSRVILDTQGAEALLGRGDMLFLPPEAAGPIRCQGVMVTDQEIERVITFWQKSIPAPDQPAPTPWDAMMEQEAMLADRDGLVEQAIAVIRETQRASASMLQRRLRIGYPRAARLIDELEELGVVGPSQSGGREREVLIGPDDEFSGAESGV